VATCRRCSGAGNIRSSLNTTFLGGLADPRYEELPCPGCGGSGEVYGVSDEQCSNCDGRGFVMYGFWLSEHSESCTVCGGTGLTSG
jgi:DnaJ-class molecular chaperone